MKGVQKQMFQLLLEEWLKTNGYEFFAFDNQIDVLTDRPYVVINEGNNYEYNTIFIVVRYDSVVVYDVAEETLHCSDPKFFEKLTSHLKPIC